MVGRVVCSKAGKDKGYFMVIVKVEGDKIFVCDGKKRPLERPKLKNRKHVSFTNTLLEEGSYETNKSIRKVLAVLRDTANKEEPKCLKKT